MRRVQAVLGLVEHARGGAVDDLGGNLLVTVSRQAVQEDRAVARLLTSALR